MRRMRVNKNKHEHKKNEREKTQLNVVFMNEDLSPSLPLCLSLSLLLSHSRCALPAIGAVDLDDNELD